MKKFLHHLHEIVAYAKQRVTLQWILRTHILVVGLSGLKMGFAASFLSEWLITNAVVIKATLIALFVGSLSWNPINLYAVGVCGDSDLDYPEDCDDNGTSNGNGCSATCDFEFGEGLACDFDNVCDPGENLYSCGQDCFNQVVCGNDICEPEERFDTCSQDCGESETLSCWNLYCDDWEDHTNCPMDCCTIVVGPFWWVSEWIGWCTDEIPGSVPFCHPCFWGNCPISGAIVTISCSYEYAPDSFETCDNGEIDDDGDDLADCEDSDCDSDPACGWCVTNGDCDDSIFCNGSEICNVGICESGSDPCEPEETCNEVDDICEAPWCVTNGDCDDSNVCNGSETCNAWTCESWVTLDCDDSVACTIDTCDTQDGCQHTTDDSECDNGLFCDGAETCDITNGCEVGTDPCGVNETCNEVDNICEGTWCSFNSDCDDSNVCNGTETCNAGECEPWVTLDCDDSVACTIDTCDTQDWCEHTTDDADCDNGLFCDGNETCHITNGCEDWTEPCTGNQTCNEWTNMCEDPTDCVVDDDCDDGNVCDGEEVCVSGVCDEGVALDCDDGVSCTDDSCDITDGCEHVTDDAVCDNGLYCDGDETCHITNGCEDGTAPCTGDQTCNEETNMCVEDEDSDGDGIPDGDEQSWPNSGDANMDEIPDYTQPTVATVTTLNIDVDATLELLSWSESCTWIISLQIQSESSMDHQDTFHIFPYGLQAFDLDCSETTVRIYFHGLEDVDDYLYRKYNGTSWTSYAITKSSLNDVPYVEFTLVDGWVGDIDGLENGVIVDPGGLGAYIWGTNNSSNSRSSITPEDLARAYGRHDRSVTYVPGTSTSWSTESGEVVAMNSRESDSEHGSAQCWTHGDRYVDGYGSCCDEMVDYVGPDLITSWVPTIFCYDPEIGEPEWRPEEEIQWRYIPLDVVDGNTTRELILEDDGGSVVYKDYYTLLQQQLSQEPNYCKYADPGYEQAMFQDIIGSREKSAILALRYFCVVQGRWKSLSSFAPESRVSRAEFIKMLVRALFLDASYEFLPEGTPYQGETPYIDVSAKHRSAQYIWVANQLGLLEPLHAEILGIDMFYPNRSITLEEMTEILLLVGDGQQLSAQTIDQMVVDDTYPMRGEIASILTRKLVSKFVDYFYIQGNNYRYYLRLLEELRGKTPQQQYRLMISQIERIQRKDARMLEEEYDIHSFRAVKYLKNLMMHQE